MERIVDKAKELQDKYVKIRRNLHKNAEVGFDLPNTRQIVLDTLTSLGYTPQRVGKGAIVATLGDEKGGNSRLLRADMDGLPISEKTGKQYACKKGNMHACGHDFHTASLLMAAELLQAEKHRLSRPVTLLFQPAEETLEGAKDVLASGLIKRFKIENAVMLHVLTGVNLPCGSVVVSSDGVSAPAADYFSLQIKGKACHGSSPQNGVDALTIACRVLLALETLSAREISTNEPFVLTVGKFQAGVAGNALPDLAIMDGTIRAMDEETRTFAKKRLKEIAVGLAKTFRGSAKLTFTSGCPALQNDGGMFALIYDTLKKGIGMDRVFYSSQLNSGEKKSLGGSEDFAYIAKEVPSVMVALAVGEPKDGYIHPLHHPKADFDERALHLGGAIYALSALT